MEIITAYKTSDGQIFENEKDAKSRELVLEAEEWYEANKLYSDYGSVDFGSVCEWIATNKKAVRKYFIS